MCINKAHTLRSAPFQKEAERRGRETQPEGEDEDENEIGTVDENRNREGTLVIIRRAVNASWSRNAVFRFLHSQFPCVMRYLMCIVPLPGV